MGDVIVTFQEQGMFTADVSQISERRVLRGQKAGRGSERHSQLSALAAETLTPEEMFSRIKTPLADCSTPHFI